MKNESINFLLIIVAYFSIGLLLSQTHIQNQRLKTINESINSLIVIEVITGIRFNLLDEKIKELEKRSKAGLTIADSMVY